MNRMQQEWKDNLLAAGAIINDDNQLSFGHSEPEPSALNESTHTICPLPQLGLIKVSGDDANSFLQNQFTNDINHVTANKGQLSAWCTPKGRALATFVIHQYNDDYYLALAADKLEASIKRLRMYVMRSKVTLDDVSQQVISFAVAGANIAEKLQDYGFDQTPEADYETVQHPQYDTLRVIRLPSATPHFVVYADVETAIALWNTLTNADVIPVSDNAWQHLNIVSGLPLVTEASSEAWIPQMLNLQVINGVSFTKGCFPGQEIVARLKYLGKNKRRLYRLALDTSELPATGERIVTEDGTEAGKVLNAAFNPEGKVEVAAVLKIAMADNVDSKALYLTEQGGAGVSVLDLPYAIEEA